MNNLKRMMVLVISSLFIFSSSACNIADQIRNNVQERIVVQEELSIQEMTRVLISSINDKNKTADAYSSIPEFQTEGLSYSYFYEYINILRDISTQDNNGKVVSFRIMSDDECAYLLGNRILNEYGQIKGAQLLYSSDVEYPLYIFYSVSPEGTVYISKDWVTSIISIYNYGNHYFTLLEEGNIDAVKTLLAPSLTDAAYTDDVVYAKASLLCDYYRLRVRSNPSEFEITTLVPGQMSVRIPETLSSDGNSFEDHNVVLTLQDDGNYNIDDKISVASDINLVYLVRGDERLIRVGNEYSYGQLLTIMGEPSSLNIDFDEGRIMILYPGLLLRFDDAYETSDSWSGTLTSIRLIGSSAYSIGYNIYNGMSRAQLLTSYPFVDESDYVIEVNTGSRSYNVLFDFNEEDLIESVRVTG
ncbi:MAG: hypothetical protein IJ757_02895 [Clostridiales bacterium]|nr:hypothetical protein [Clostridiales bacterium]